MKEIDQRPVGIFDSGVGGLTVVREVLRNIPNERIVYFGDTARVPYGSKSRETVLKYSRQIIRFLQTREVKAIVIACNTASAFALEEVKKELDIPIIGVIEPGARVACEATRNGKIGVIGTEGTVSSRIHEGFILKKRQDVEVYGKACPLFTPLVEEHLLKDSVTDEMTRRYLTGLMDIGIDTLILGCTHYPLIRSTIREFVGDKVQLVNPAYETALDLKELLQKNGIDHKEPLSEPDKDYQFFVSDSEEKFKQFADSILPCDIETIKRINIEEF